MEYSAFPDRSFPKYSWPYRTWPGWTKTEAAIEPATVAPTGGSGLTLQPDWKEPIDARRKKILSDDDELMELAGYITASGIIK